MGAESEVEDYLRRRIGNTIEAIQRVPKEDLDMVPPLHPTLR